MLINEFYANREVFITGGTGFLGKALIEKLLRDSPKIKVLYILLRAKKSLSITERLEQFKRDKVFDQLHQTCPEALKKLYPIQGDSGELGLGIQASDLKLMQNVSIIFHMAANVKFDDPLRSSILLNTRGTYELVKIAETLKNLVVFFHCSTAYCNPFEAVTEEKIYDMPVEWRTAIKIAETYDEDTLNALFYKYTGHYPNSYTFTKNLSEQLIKDYSSKLPVSLFRPSVVINAFKEPKAGWTDNLNGPVALMVALSVGVLPIAFCKHETILDAVPIDLVTKLTIVAAYKRGLQFLRKEPIPNGLEVINCASGGIYHVNMSGAAALYDKESRKNPMENKIWDYSPPTITGCYYYYMLQLFTIAIPLGIVLDTLLRVKGQKPKMITMLRRIAYATKALFFFTSKTFKMVNTNMLNLENFIADSDVPTYGVKAAFNMDVMPYFEDIVKGVKYYLFNQPMEATEAARSRANILFLINRSIKVFLCVFISLYLYSALVK